MKTFDNKLDRFIDYLSVIGPIILFVSLVLVCFFSCKTERSQLKMVTLHDSVYIEKVHDSIVNVLKKDTSSLGILFKCDSMNNVYIYQLNELQGKKIQTKFVFKDNYLYVNSTVDSLQVALKWKERIIKTDNNTVKTVVLPPVVTNKMNVFQRFFFWTGFLFFLFIIIYTIYRIFGNKIKTWIKTFA